MRSFPLALALLALCACGDSPVRRNVGTGKITTTIGPAGAVLRDDGSDPLRGFELRIPPGALDHVVDVTVETVADIDFQDSAPVGRCFAIRMRPDPGPLLALATLRLRMALPVSRPVSSLFVARRTDPERASALTPGVARVVIASDAVGYDPVTEVMSASVGDLDELQIRSATRARHTEDALRLAQSAYSLLAQGSSTGLRDADAALAQAQQIDPFTALPHLLRAISRVLIVLDDRSDTTSGIDSVGEALAGLGLDLRSRGLFERILAGDWPSTVVPPPGGPTLETIAAALRDRLRPAIDAALLDLDLVPSSAGFVLTLPAVFRGLPGQRELDAADPLMLRSLYAAASFWLDWLATLDLDVRPADLGGAGTSLESILLAHPQTARSRRGVDIASLQSLRAALDDLRSAFDSIAAETDSQGDDLVVIPHAVDAAARTEWRADLDAIRGALDAEVATQLRVSGSLGSLDLRLHGPLTSGSFDVRAALPAFLGYLPLAGTLADPTFGGVLPTLTQVDATQLFGGFDRRPMARRDVVADGDFADWAQVPGLLDPADPRGDASGGRRLGVDIEQVAYSLGTTALAFRVTVADGEIALRPQHATAFVMRLRDVGRTHLSETVRVEVVLQAGAPLVRVFLRGSQIAASATAVASGSDLEVAVDRALLDDEIDLARSRVFDVRSEDFDLSTGGVVRDGVRGVILLP
ncbi:MAG: hypothetical protein U1F36_16770 [Planctomycetota bacterium]